MHQMLSPGSSGLFAKAIAQSGAFYGGLALRPKSAAREAEKGPYKVLAEIGKTRLKLIQSPCPSQAFENSLSRQQTFSK